MNVKYRHLENTQSFLFHLFHTDLVTCGSLLAKHGDIFKINVIKKTTRKRHITLTCGIEALSLLS